MSPKRARPLYPGPPGTESGLFSHITSCFSLSSCLRAAHTAHGLIARERTHSPAARSQTPHRAYKQATHRRQAAMSVGASLSRTLTCPHSPAAPEALCSQAQAQRTADGMAPTATLLSAASRADIPAAPSQIIILSPPQHAARQNDSAQGSGSTRTSSSSGSPSPNVDGTANSPQTSQTEGVSTIASSGSTSPTQEVDPQILEALKSKDRLYVLKQAELIETLICERTWVAAEAVHSALA